MRTRDAFRALTRIQLFTEDKCVICPYFLNKCTCLHVLLAQLINRKDIDRKDIWKHFSLVPNKQGRLVFLCPKFYTDEQARMRPNPSLSVSAQEYYKKTEAPKPSERFVWLVPFAWRMVADSELRAKERAVCEPVVNYLIVKKIVRLPDGTGNADFREIGGTVNPFCNPVSKEISRWGRCVFNAFQRVSDRHFMEQR